MVKANPLRPARDHAIHRVYDIKSGLFCVYVEECLPCQPVEQVAEGKLTSNQWHTHTIAHAVRSVLY